MKKIILSLFLFLTLINFPVKPVLADSLCGSCVEQANGQCSRGQIKCVKGKTICCCGQISGGNSCSQVPGSVQATIPPNGIQTSIPPGQDPTCTPVGGNAGEGIDSAIGCIPVGNTNAFMGWILGWAVGVGGGIAFLLIVYASFMVMTSQGVPERLNAGRELLTSAISGLIMLIFSVYILKFIGIDVLGLDKL